MHADSEIRESILPGGPWKNRFTTMRISQPSRTVHKKEKQMPRSNMLREDIALLEGPFLKTAAGQLEPNVLQTLDSLYAFYHRQWWCYMDMYRLFKYRQTLLNGLALLVMAAGMIAGSVFENTIVVTCLAALGTFIKGWNDFKKLSVKVDMCQFAYTTYAKTLNELRNYVRGMPFDEDGFLIKMQTFDDTITDFSPPVSDDCTQKYHHRFRYMPVEGMCFADGCPREPILNTSHIPLRDKKTLPRV